MAPVLDKCPRCGGPKKAVNDMCLGCRRATGQQDGFKEPEEHELPTYREEFQALALKELERGTQSGTQRAQVYAILALGAERDVTEAWAALGEQPPPETVVRVDR